MEKIYHKLAPGLSRDLACQLGTEDRELVFNFFLTFSRLEYALMKCGYSTGNEKRISIDWDKFADDNQHKFYELLDTYRNKELKEAVEYYQENPPVKQVLINGIVSLKPEVPKEELQFKELINLVKRVRKNLLHGEKLSQLLSDDPERDRALLQHGLVVLYTCIDVKTDLKQYFS
ncbi:MAG: hypothetical protein P8016_00170 [Sedimentisphaerales bacterium]